MLIKYGFKFGLTLTVLTGVTLCSGAVFTPAEAAGSEVAPMLKEVSGIDKNQLPKALGGKLSGIKTYTETVEGYGEITITANFDTGEIVSHLPDGSIQRTTYQKMVQDTYEAMQRMTPQQQQLLISLAQNKISKKDVCPYLVAFIGAGQGAAWEAALGLVAVNPAIGFLVAMGNTFFWAWVGTHC